MKGDDALGFALKKIAEKGGDAPVVLEAEVFSTLDNILLLADIVGLFTVKFTLTELQAFDAAFSDEQANED